MNHSFNVEIATKYGLEEAIILENIYFWCKKNEANGHLIEGQVWTYNSVKAFNELFSYLSPAVITRALKNLETNGLLKTGFFNSNAYNRTKWYCVTDEARKYFESEITEKKKVSEEVKRVPLIDRDPKNDLEKVEKLYLVNYKTLYKNGYLKMEKPVINWTASRKLTKNAIEKYGLETILKAVKKSKENKFCLQSGYVLTTILSAGVLAQLINAQDTRGIANDELNGSEVINF